jgi:hypothetical protein
VGHSLSPITLPNDAPAGNETDMAVVQGDQAKALSIRDFIIFARAVLDGHPATGRNARANEHFNLVVDVDMALTAHKDEPLPTTREEFQRFVEDDLFLGQGTRRQKAILDGFWLNYEHALRALAISGRQL